MEKNSAFIGVGSSPLFEYSSEAVYCYSSILRLEIMPDCDITIASLLSFFGIDWNRVKTTRLGDFYKVKEEEVAQIVEEYSYAKEVFLECLRLSLDEAKLELISARTKTINPVRIAALADVITIKNGNAETKVPERLLKLVFLKNNNDKSQLYHEIMLMSNDYYDLKLSSFFGEKTVNDLLSLLNISTYGDLVHQNIDFVYPFFINDFDYLIRTLKACECDSFEDFEKETDALVALICNKNPRLMDVFMMRYHIGVKEKLTLEEVGLKFSLTRERIRQIEAKAIGMIIKHGKNLNRYITMLLLLCFKKNNYVNRSNLVDRFSNAIYVDFLSAFTSCFFSNDFEYNEQLECFLKKGDSANIEESLIIEYPIVISMDEFLHFDSAKKNIAKKLYNLKMDKVYLRKGFAFSDVVLMAFDALFPKGGRISEETCKKISQYIMDRYDVVFELNWHVLQSYFARNNYCLVDRGTYINRKYASSVGEGFYQRILGYVLSRNDIVYYSQIFSEFKNDFLECGINTWFYAKGVIDPLFPSTIKTRKDYCCRVAHDGNVTTHFENIFRNHGGIINLDTFLRENPGVKDYILFNYVNNNYDKVLWLSNKTFVNVNFIYISKLAATIFEEEINNLFQLLNTNVITDSKLYVRIKNLYPELLADMAYIKNAFDLYSLVRFLLQKDYFFNRPFISKDYENLTYARVLRNYLISLDRFDLRIVQSYCSRMHLRLYNYLDLLIDMSDEFIQITKDGCINKRVFAITSSELDELKGCINYYINSFGAMDLRIFNGFPAFPKLKYQWNQYLLIGIVTTFFGDAFEIVYTDGQYNLTSYIIRRR